MKKLSSESSKEGPKKKKGACRGSIFYVFNEEGKFLARFIQMRERQRVKALRGKQEVSVVDYFCNVFEVDGFISVLFLWR